MNPNLPMMPQQGLHPLHNQMYEQLRQIMMQLHQAGVPGMDRVLNALNQSHIAAIGGQPTWGSMPPQGGARPTNGMPRRGFNY